MTNELDKWRAERKRESELELTLVASLAGAHPEIPPDKLARSVRNTLDKIRAMAYRIEAKSGRSKTSAHVPRKGKRAKRSGASKASKSVASQQ